MTSPPRREVFLEFRQVGNCVKATAMDPETLIEVSVVGPARGGKEMLRRTVLAKLDYMIKRNAKGPAK